MENKIDNQENNKRTWENDPQYFGSYLNMARHNVYLLNNHLTDVFNLLGFEKINDDGEIHYKDVEPTKSEKVFLLNIFDTEKNEYEDYRMRVFNYLLKRHHLPLIKIFSKQHNPDLFESQQDVDFKGLHIFLNLALTELEKFRNDYTHYLSIDNEGNRIIRKKDIHFWSGPELTYLFKHAPRFSFLRNTADPKQIKNPTEKDYKHLDYYTVLTSNNNTELTDNGLYFFICLFLERQYAFKFLKRFKGFKDERTPSFKATLQSFSSYALRLPSEKLGNENPKQKLLLDMLTELEKCPKELFEHLTEDDKKKFQPELDEEATNNVLNNSLNYSEIDDSILEKAISDLTSQIRYSDRFPYFALRYLEETNAFENLRFQITLGKLELRKYDKTILSVPQNRTITKIITAFGKLTDFENEDKTLSELKKTAPEVIGFEQYAPHYNFSDESNKIAFVLLNEDDKIRYMDLTSENTNNLPTGYLSIHDLPKLALLQHLKPQEAEKLITDFIHTNNVAMLNAELIETIKSKANYDIKSFTRKLIDYSVFFSEKQKAKKEVELGKRNDYKNHIKNRQKILKPFLEKENLVYNQLPSRVKDELLKISSPSDEKIIHFRIRNEKQKAKELLRKLENQLSENGNKIKYGELATFLTRDIIKMIVTKECKQRITSPYSSKLQNKIAYFGIEKENVIALCKELNLFDNQNGHVFLKENHIKNSSLFFKIYKKQDNSLYTCFDKTNGLIAFYQIYLIAKIDWINKTLLPNRNEKTKKYRLPINGNKIPLVYEKWRTKEVVFEQWLKTKANLPVNLPTSLFDYSLNNELKNKLKIDISSTDTFAVLLNKFLKGDTQPYYDFVRSYYKKLQNNNSDNNDEEPEYIQQNFCVTGLNSKQLKIQFGKNVEANEKLIRFTQTKDRLMRLMIETLILEDESLFGKGDKKRKVDIRLKEFHDPFSQNKPLDIPMSFEQKIIINKENNDFCTVTAEDTQENIEKVLAWKSLNKHERKINKEKRVGYRWTLKDYGRLKRFVTDKRILSIAPYFEDKNNIPFILLEYELQEYNRVREKIFDHIFDIEKVIYEKDECGIVKIELENRKKKVFNNVQFKVFLTWLKDKLKIDESVLEFLRFTRNKFSHSQYPDFSIEKAGFPKFKITVDDVKNFIENEQIEGYKGKTYISIAQQIYENYCEIIYGSENNKCSGLLKNIQDYKVIENVNIN